MRLGEMNTGTLKSPAGMTRAEIESTVKHIVAAVVDEHGLMEAGDVVSLDSNLHNDLGMDEVDLIEVLFRAEERFGLILPDSDIGPSSTVSDIVDLIAERLSEKEARSSAGAALQSGVGQRSRTDSPEALVDPVPIACDPPPRPALKARPE